jgi:hypothetical protein
MCHPFDFLSAVMAFLALAVFAAVAAKLASNKSGGQFHSRDRPTFCPSSRDSRHDKHQERCSRQMISRRRNKPR